MNALSNLLGMAEGEKAARGLLYTPSEIAQQPATWQSTYALFQRRSPEIREYLRAAGVWASDFKDRPAIFLIGAGTSDYVGQSLSQLLRQAWQCEVTAIPSTDLLTHQQELTLPSRRYLWISFSRSGDSPEGVAVLRESLQRRPDIRHLVVCCNAKGRMLEEISGQPQALGILLHDAVNDRGLAMTSSFTNMVILGHCLAHTDNLAPYEEMLEKLVHAAKSFLPNAAERAAELATLPFTKACMVGSGPLRGVARESALKLLEMTAGKTVTMSESALGLRHGPMAALDKSTLFVCFLSGDPRIRKFEMDLLKEIGDKQLVHSRVMVAREEVETKSLAEYFLSPAMPLLVSDHYRAPVDVIFGQLLGLFFSLRWNLRPDSPSPNGAISRVVQNVNIHG